MAGERRLWGRWQPRLVEGYFVQRIENLVGGGVPDVHLLSRADGSQHWLELKAIAAVPKRAGTPVFGKAGLRPEQIAWIYGRALAGGSVWVLAGAGDWTFLVNGCWAREFNGMTLGELIAAATWKLRGRFPSGKVYPTAMVPGLVLDELSDFFSDRFIPQGTVKGG